jgi:hypothetical protein
MKAVRIIISVVSWSWLAIVIYNLWKDHRELSDIQARTAETTRKTKYHF